MFKEVPSQFDFPGEEKKILEFWESSRIYEKSLELRKGKEPFVFYEGPPTANGLPHPGHCLTRAIKDLFPRYKTMCGYYCERKAGWDTHGLPVEVEVCKELGIHSKEEIEAYGMEPFIHKCVESVFRYTREWEEVTRRLGFWVDMEGAYVTYHQPYVESVWWALKSFFDAGLLYRGAKIVWWWAQGGTALSAHEVGQGYREVDDPSVFVRFPLVDDEASLLVWTTTPWTLVSNHFVAVHPDITYARVRDAENGEELYIARDLVEAIAAKEKRTFDVISTGPGRELLGRRYRPPFDFYYETLGDKTAKTRGGEEIPIGWRVVEADFVTTDSGTGLVHEAPPFGEVDYDVLQREREAFENRSAIPMLCAVDPAGRFTDEAPPYQGQWVKDADKQIIRDLQEKKLLFHREQYRHDYPFCWRAEEDPLIQYPRESWFVRTTQFVDDMLANNTEIHWLPDHIRTGRFGKFLESNVDWSLSRERYWGTPLPIWVCDESGKMEAIGSYGELLDKPGVQGTEVWEEAKAANPDLNEHLKIHRPYIDAVTYASPFAEGARMRRVPEVIDCWFDSGSMPFAQLGYPHHNAEAFEPQFPCDFISEALDQTRGWFYSLLAISTLLFGRKGVAREAAGPDWPVPYRNCIVLGLLLGEDGFKMSKSKKNYRTPEYIFDREGADAMRWLFFSGQPPWTSIRFQEKAIEEGQREFLIRLFNVYVFFVIYANIDGWQPEGALRGALPEAAGAGEGARADRWILSELNRTIAAVRESMDRFENFPAARALNEFVDALSNWYVRRSRPRFWKSGLDADKRAAYATLYHCLVTVTELAAPFVPFFTEAIYGNLVKARPDAESFPESVHLCDYPEFDHDRIDESLSRDMALVREVVSLGRAVRAQAKRKVRLPLSQGEVVLADSSQLSALEPFLGMIEDELNVKKVEPTTEADEYVNYHIKPNFRSIGPRFGKLAPAVKKTLAEAEDPAELRRRIDEEGRIELVVDGQVLEITAEDVQVTLEAKPGWAAAQGRRVVVVLQTDVTPELEREGMAREIVHHVQSIRKKLDLRYEQRIELAVAGDDEIAQVVEEFGDYIQAETLATELATDPLDGVDVAEAVFDGKTASIWVKPS